MLFKRLSKRRMLVRLDDSPFERIDERIDVVLQVADGGVRLAIQLDCDRGRKAFLGPLDQNSQRGCRERERDAWNAPSLKRDYRKASVRFDSTKIKTL